MVMDKEGVYNKAQVMPQFPGGQDALADYVNNHVEYPQQAIDNNTTGTVMVSFVVDEKGKVENAHVIGKQAPKDGLDKEALRVVNNMPDWKPGKVRGRNVKTRLELPINFQLEA
jgi:TonB family protein